MDNRPDWKWQKVKLKEKDKDGEPFLYCYPHLVNCFLWVKIGPPQSISAVDRRGFGGTISGYNSNLMGWDRPKLAFPAEALEWLARGPEDFAEMVPVIPFEVWSDPNWKGEL